MLKRKFPEGVDLVIEHVGGRMLQTAINNCKKGGKVVIVGYISQVRRSFAPLTMRSCGNQMRWGRVCSPALVNNLRLTPPSLNAGSTRTIRTANAMGRCWMSRR